MNTEVGKSKTMALAVARTFIKNEIKKKLLIQHRKATKLEVISENLSEAIQKYGDVIEDDTRRRVCEQFEKSMKGFVHPDELSVGQRLKLLFTGNV